MTKAYIDVCVEYSGFSRELDSRLEDVARKHEGRRADSGYGFMDGSRDISFEFKDLKTARSFYKAAKRFKSVKHAYSRSRLDENDYE